MGDIERLTPSPNRTDVVYRSIAVVGTTFLIVFAIVYLKDAHPPFDSVGYLIGRDFVNDWMGARAAQTGDPGQWYDFTTYNAALKALFGSNFWNHNWSYPPTLLLFVAPFGGLSYLVALMVWSVVGLGLYLAVAAEGDYRWDRLLLLVAAPAVTLNLFTGQTGFFVAALLIAALTRIDERPVRAGIMFGLLTIKPQLGLLIPIMLLASWRWRCLAATIVTTLGLAAATALFFGPRIWLDYVTLALPVQTAVMTKGTGIFIAMSPTPFMNMRLLDAPLAAAFAVQGVVSFLAVGATIWTFSRRRDPVLSWALLIVLAFLATPYAFGYDMVIFGWLALRLKDHDHPILLDHILLVAAWIFPIASIFVGPSGVPGAPLIFMALAARLMLRLAAQSGDEGELRLSATPTSRASFASV